MPAPSRRDDEMSEDQDMGLEEGEDDSIGGTDGDADDDVDDGEDEGTIPDDQDDDMEEEIEGKEEGDAEVEEEEQSIERPEEADVPPIDDEIGEEDEIEELEEPETPPKPKKEKGKKRKTKGDGERKKGKTKHSNHLYHWPVLLTCSFFKHGRSGDQIVRSHALWSWWKYSSQDHLKKQCKILDACQNGTTSNRLVTLLREVAFEHALCFPTGDLVCG